MSNGLAADYVVEPLDDRHDRQSFSCGVEALDRYLQRQAGQDQRRRLAAVYVLVASATPAAIAGYYSLCATAIEAADLPDTLTRRLAKYPVLPAILLGRLAIDQRFMGKGLGAVLLFDALRRSLRSDVAAMAVVVDAKDDNARAFYAHFGFARFPEQQYRLYLPMSTIAKLLP